MLLLTWATSCHLFCLVARQSISPVLLGAFDKCCSFGWRCSKRAKTGNEIFFYWRCMWSLTQCFSEHYLTFTKGTLRTVRDQSGPVLVVVMILWFLHRHWSAHASAVWTQSKKCVAVVVMFSGKQSKHCRSDSLLIPPTNFQKSPTHFHQCTGVKFWNHQWPIDRNEYYFEDKYYCSK